MNTTITLEGIIMILHNFINNFCSSMSNGSSETYNEEIKLHHWATLWISDRAQLYAHLCLDRCNVAYQRYTCP